MKLITLPLLRSAFMAVARLPLNGPHQKAEADLLLAGAKPLGTFWPGTNDDDISRLDSAVEQGHLIRGRFERTMRGSIHIYGTPEVLDRAADIERRAFAAEWSGTPDSDPVFMELRHERQESRHFPAYDPPSVKNAITALAAGTMSSVSIKAFMLQSTSCATALQRLLQDNNSLTCRVIECEAPDTFLIYGQPGQEDNMAALGTIVQTYYRDPGISPRDEGRLLGYSDNDTHFWTNRQDYSRMAWLALYHTHTARLNLRHALMKEYGAAWPRNP